MAGGVGIVFLAVVCLVAKSSATEDMVLNVNTKKPVAVVSEKFLSITLDPVIMFNSDALKDVERSISMARSLAPAYVRLGGPRSNSYSFERGLYPEEPHPNPSYTFSEAHWIHVHRWAAHSGLDVIACVAPQQSDTTSNGRIAAWDPRNALDLIAFSDHMGYNTSWQLGYECQTRCDISGAELGRDVQRLRNMLDAFPRYAERGLVIGPDAVAFKTHPQQQYLQDYFNGASGALAAVTWHPNFAGVSMDAEGVSMSLDNLAAEKENFYRVVGRHISKKPLWLAESRPEECKRLFLGALVWARRLGNSAKLGVQVLMRQPENSNLFRPTPDYWVSMMHKQLVGREVLDTRIAAGNRTHVHFYCHCTRPSTRYERGSLTVFGINLTPTKVTASLKGLKLTTVHKYILLPGYDAPNRMFAETILLNNEPLSLINGKEVPEVRPIVSNAEKGVKLKLPSGGIGFWVLPGLEIKTCMGHENEIVEKNLLKRINKHLQDMELEEDTEVENESNQESTDNGNSDEKKSPMRQPHTDHRRTLVRRNSANHRHGEGPEDRSRIHEARHEVDRMEKMMRRRGHYPQNLKTNAHHLVYEHSSEVDESNEGSVLGRFRVDRKIDSGEVIREKFDRYKKRLEEYENKKKQRKLVGKDVEIDERKEPNKGMEAEKVIEALTLMTKVESAIKGLEKESESERGRPTREVVTLITGDSSEVTAALSRSGQDPKNNNDGLLDEVLKTEKAKRTSVPTSIEGQMKALYQLLSEEKNQKDDPSSLRPRRDIDKRAAEESALVLGQNGSYFRKRSKSDELKERRLERKQRLREKAEELKREKDDRREFLDSDENNFYGFHYSEPLQNFPAGDLYLRTGQDSEEKKHGDAQVIRIEENKEQRHSRQNPTRTSGVTNIRDENEDTWLEEGDGNHMPNEFYENVKLQNFNPKENLKNYGELWEAQSVLRTGEPATRIEEQNRANNYAITDVVTERPIPASDDHIAKEKAMQHLVNYYQADPNEKYDFGEIRQQQLQQQVQYTPQAVPQYHQDPAYVASPNYYADPKYSGYIDANGYYIDPRQYPQADQTVYQRKKRRINDVEDVMHREMISQDDNNLKDCQCRVIRGVRNCKGCDVHTNNYPAMNLGKGIRLRRSVDLAEIKNFNEDLKDGIGETIGSAAQGEVDETTSPVEPEELEDAANGEISLEDSNEGTEINESSTVQVEDQMKLETENEKLLANRLPRKTDLRNQFFLDSQGATETTKTNIQFYRRKNADITNIQKVAGNTNGKEKIASTANNDSKSDAIISEKSKITNIIKDKSKIANITNDEPKIIDIESNKSKSNKIGNNPAANTVSNTSKTVTEHVANIRSVNNAAAQVGSAATLKPLAAKPFGQKEPFRSKDSGAANAFYNFPIQPVVEKSSQISSDGSKLNQSFENLSTTVTILNKLNSTQDQTNTNSKNIKKTVSAMESKNKKIIENSNVEDIRNSRPTRLTTRAEALAALKQENESRYAKKMIETSMKIIDSENARFVEHQRRRREQLEKLKLKLRAKREKMLQQYREELIEAINESSDSTSRNIHRRHLLDNYHNMYDQLSGKNDRTSNSDKLAYIMRYRPVRYAERSNEDEKYIPVIEVIRPYHDSTKKRSSLKNKPRIGIDDVFENYETLKDMELNTPSDKILKDAIFNASDDQEYRGINQKRSLVSISDKYATLDESHNRKPVVHPMGGDSGEYYSEPQKMQHPQYEQYQDQLYDTQTHQEDQYLQQLEQQQQQQQPPQQQLLPPHQQQQQQPPQQQQQPPQQQQQPPQQQLLPFHQQQLTPHQQQLPPHQQQPQQEDQPPHQQLPTHQLLPQYQQQPQQQEQPPQQQSPHQQEQQPHQQFQTEIYYQHPPQNQAEGIPLHMKYNAPPPNIHEVPSQNFYATYEQQPDMSYYMMNPENRQPSQNAYYQQLNYRNLQRPRSINNYYRVNQEYEQDSEGDYEADLHGYEIIEPDYRKSKRSNFKIIEIDPSLYENEPDDYYEEYYARPSRRFSSRHYRQNPYSYEGKRYRREAVLNEEEDSKGPLSFSLGLEKSKMHNTAGENASPDPWIRKKRVAENFVSTDEKPYHTVTSINKNVKKVYKADDEKKSKKSARYKRVVKKSLQIPDDFMDDEICKIYDTFDNTPSKLKSLELENYLDFHARREGLLKRKKRSDNSYVKYEVIKGNAIDRSEDPEMDEIWNNIVEMKQDEKLLEEFDRKKNQIIQNFRDTQNNFKNVESLATCSSDEASSTSTKIPASTTQTNIESMLVDAIPKLENVITGGLKKAQNLTGSVEDFIDNFGSDPETTENSQGNSESSDAVDQSEATLSHNVFKSVVGSVKKFFGLVTGIAKIFHEN